MKTPEISPIVTELAPLILAEIRKANSVILHCHPSPDPDSVGSALAMKFAVEGLGKKATVISGDSVIPDSFKHFPGANEIVCKTFNEIDQNGFDLFIAVDSAAVHMVTRRGDAKFGMPVIVIDHHPTNTRYGSINLVEPNYPATGQVLYDLFQVWGIEITPEIAQNLFIGIYTDTGGFKYPGVSDHTFQAAARLVEKFPDMSTLISKVENSNSPEFVAFEAVALSNIETFLGGHLAVSFVDYGTIKSKNIPAADVRTSEVSSFMRTVPCWDVVASAVEIEPGKVKFSFRSRDAVNWDVSKLSKLVNEHGGGHKMAAGAVVDMSLDEARVHVVAKAKELYNL